MNLEARNKRIQEYQQEQMEILDAKGADYTGGKASEDGNHNFSEVARRLAGAPMNAMTVWAVYFLKHCLAVETFVKLGRVESEGMEGRFNDLANYANIGRAIFEEMQRISSLEAGVVEREENVGRKERIFLEELGIHNFSILGEK